MNKALAVAVGAALFGAVQAVLFRVALPVPAVRGGGWFLNTGTGALAVAATFAALGAIVGASRRDGVLEAMAAAAGAIVAMVVVLFWIGRNNIYPMAVFFGVFLIGGVTAIGIAFGTIARGGRSPKQDRPYRSL